MTEAVFPVAGAALVFLVFLPGAALLTKLLLDFVDRSSPTSALHGMSFRFVALASSSALPLGWLISAGLHQVESGRTVLSCLFQHEVRGVCLEPGFFSLLVGLVAWGLWARELSSSGLRARRSRAPHSEFRARLARLSENEVSLSWLQGRVRVTCEPGFAIATQGLLRPYVIVGEQFARGLSDESLAGALAHEAAHVRAFDPLRFFFLQFCLAVNPLGRRFLASHASRWVAAREAHCDREAVVSGAEPLALALAIVRAARPHQEALVALGAPNTSVLRFRVDMLLAFAERRPSRCCHRSDAALPVVLSLLTVALVLPHQTGTFALDLLHQGAEHALASLFK